MPTELGPVNIEITLSTKQAESALDAIEARINKMSSRLEGIPSLREIPKSPAERELSIRKEARHIERKKKEDRKEREPRRDIRGVLLRAQRSLQQQAVLFRPRALVATIAATQIPEIASFGLGVVKGTMTSIGAASGFPGEDIVRGVIVEINAIKASIGGFFKTIAEMKDVLIAQGILKSKPEIADMVDLSGTFYDAHQARLRTNATKRMIGSEALGTSAAGLLGDVGKLGIMELQAEVEQLFNAGKRR